MSGDPGLSWRKPGKDYGDLTSAQVIEEIRAHAAEYPLEREPREAEGEGPDGVL